MADLTLHFLDARGGLTPHRDWLSAILRAAHTRIRSHLALGPLDVVVRSSTLVIPEKGHVGHAPAPGVVFLSVDPSNAAFLTNANASLERMLAHELHHAARWDGPGYGRSLGEALVSEGLAGHFVREVYGGDPEPWERVPRDALQAHLARAADAWSGSGYSHSDWFFGTGDLPRWLGYSLGFAVVGVYLDENGTEQPSRLAAVDAQVFRPYLDRL